MFQQHQGESFSEAWTHFKDLLQKFPHHGIDLWLQVKIFYDRIDHNLKWTVDYAVGGWLRKISAEKAWATIEELARYEDEGWNDLVTLGEGSLNYENPDIEQLLGVMECKVDTLMKEAISLMGRSESVFGMTSNTVYQLPSKPSRQEGFENLVVGKLKEEIRMEKNRVKKIEKITREVPSFDGPEPQPLLNSPSLDVSLGDVIGPEPPIKPHSSDSSRMKEMFDDDWGLESKEFSPLGEELSLFDRLNKVERGRILEAHRLEPILQQRISQRMAPSHHNGNSSSKTKISFSQNMETASQFTRDAVTTTPVTRLYLMRRSLEVLRKFHWMILGGRFNKLSHVSSPLLSKPGDY
ncbi:hypothetical protein Tco_0507811 [Tanacetum coccineum]